MTDHLRRYAERVICGAVENIEFMSVMEQFEDLLPVEAERVYELIMECELEVKFK